MFIYFKRAFLIKKTCLVLSSSGIVIILIFLLACAGNPELKAIKSKVKTQSDSLKTIDRNVYEEFQLLKNAGATLFELEAYSDLRQSPKNREEIAKKFWNKRVQQLSSEEQSIYYSIYLPSVQKDYLSLSIPEERAKCYKKYLKRLESSLSDAQKDSLVFLTYVSSKKEALEWLKLQPDKREPWMNNFWQNRNPDPSSSYNHFKFTMERRWEECRNRGYFTLGHLDTRGGIWLKKGRPYEELLTGAGQTQYNTNPRNWLNPDPLDARFVDAKDEDVIQWVYKDGSCFQFQVKNSEWITVPCQTNMKDPLMSLSPKGHREPTGFDNLAKSVIAVNNTLAKPAEYSYDYGGSPFKNITYKIYMLSNNNGTADLVLSYGIPLKELKKNKDSLSYFRRVSLWDKRKADFLPIDSSRVTFPAQDFSANDLLMGKLHYRLSEGEYDLALFFKDKFSDRVGIYQDTSIWVVPFVHPDSMEVNEIVLSPLITTFESNYSGYERQGYAIQFLPHNLIRGNSLCAYTEVFNLKKKKGASFYSVSYYYKEEKEPNWREPPIAFLPEQMDNSSIVALSRCFDITNLSEGKYLIMAEIKDLNSPQLRKKQVVGEFNRILPKTPPATVAADTSKQLTTKGGEVEK
jgi:GWxTD domain-containing protein